MPAILQLDLQQIVSQALTFVLLVWVLKRFAWKPILGILDERKARIEEDLRQAAQSREEMSRLQQDYAQRLAKIDEEARAKIQQSIQDGRRIAAEIQDEARVQAQQLVAKSQETIALELAKAKVSLRNELADLTMDAVERLLKDKVTVASDEKLVASILDELGQASNG